jgi:FixJ family two-component response regulator
MGGVDISKASDVTVYVIDDDKSVCRGVGRLLKSAGYTAEIFNRANDFLGAKRSAGFGCIILDVEMPGLSGLELQEALAAGEGRPLPIIFVTGHGDIPMSVEAMKKGAVDFIPKPFDDTQLLAAVEKAIEQDRVSMALFDEQAEIQERVEALTPREYEVFGLVIMGLLNKQIAYELGISEKTVKVHRARVMEKMRVPSVAELVHLAEKVGIKPLDDREMPV